MNKWPHAVTTLTQAEILKHVDDPEWQIVRLGMKGMPTPKKLDILDAYRYNRLQADTLERKYQVQIDNYINALKRGGLLNDALEVVR
jgi:hypothetical protein